MFSRSDAKFVNNKSFEALCTNQGQKLLHYQSTMGKAVAFTSKFAMQKCNNKREDYISRLPDEILVIILSGLSMREAARSSILSRRWIRLWTLFAGSLVFDGSETLFEIKWKGKSLKFERTRFVNWVNQVLRLHQGPSVGELKVCFDLDNHFKFDIDAWIEFAIRKKIRKLELDFKPTYVGGQSYTSPSPLPLKNLTLCSLTALRLSSVSVTGDVLEYLLSHIPFLEVITVEFLQDLVSFNVSGPSLKLKYLEILCCFGLKDLEISAENLISFKYKGPNIQIPFKHVPSLVDVSFAGDFSMYATLNLRSFSCYFMQLEKLSLFLETNQAIFPPMTPELRNLKYLELAVSDYNRRSLLSCIFLLEASPLLHEFTLKIGNEGSITLIEEGMASIWKIAMEGITRKCQYLKVVELVGSVGSIVVEFMKFVLENVASPEKLIVNPRIWWNERLPDESGQVHSEATIS